MDFSRIRSVMDSLAGSAATEVRIKTAEMELHLRFSNEAPDIPEVTVAAPADLITGLIEVVAPMPGVVYLAPSPSAPSFVEAGKRVAAGETLLLIEAMKSMLPVQAPIDGTVETMLVADEDTVAAAQVLVRICPVSA